MFVLPRIFAINVTYVIDYMLHFFFDSGTLASFFDLIHHFVTFKLNTQYLIDARSSRASSPVQKAALRQMMSKNRLVGRIAIRICLGEARIVEQFSKRRRPERNGTNGTARVETRMQTTNKINC